MKPSEPPSTDLAEDDDTDVVELSPHEIVPTRILAVNDPPTPPPPNSAPPRPPALPPPRALEVRSRAPRPGTTRPGMGTVSLSADAMDDDTFSGRDTSTYHRVPVEPVKPIDPHVVAKTILMPVGAPPVTERMGQAAAGASDAAPPTAPSAGPAAGASPPAPPTRASASPPGHTVQVVMPPLVTPAPTPSATDLPLYADEAIPAPFPAPRTEPSPGVRRRSTTTAILGATAGVLVVLAGFFAPRIYRSLVERREHAGALPVASASAWGEVATSLPSASPSSPVPSVSTPPPIVERPSSASASATTTAEAPVPSASSSASVVAAKGADGSVCAEDRGLPAELCAYVDAIRAGGDPPRPTLASFQRFLLTNDITRIRGRILADKGAGIYAITLSGSFGYCLESPRALEVGSLFIGWAARGKADDTCARFRALSFPDTIDRLLASADATERRRLADALASELASELARR